MYCSPILTLACLLTLSLNAFSQEEAIETVLSSPADWPSEIIPFPISFAEDIPFEGFEDLRFQPGWRDSTSAAFWSYCFVWYVERDYPLTVDLLTEYFNSYYDGLMGIDHRNQADSTGMNQLERTHCEFNQSPDGFSGTMRIWDAFTSFKYLTLNVHVTEEFCLKQNKQIIRCDISPKAFDHQVWQAFEQVTIKDDCY